MNRGFAISVMLLVGMLSSFTGCTAWSPGGNAPCPYNQAAWQTPVAGNPAIAAGDAPVVGSPVAAAPTGNGMVVAKPVPPDRAESSSPQVVRGQDAAHAAFAQQVPGTDAYQRSRMPVTQVQYQAPLSPSPAAAYDPYRPQPGVTYNPPPAANAYPPPAGNAYPPAAGNAYPPPAYAAPGTNPMAPVMPPPGSAQPYMPTSPNPGPVVPLITPGAVGPPGSSYVDIDPTMTTPVDVYVEETQTGRFMFGAGVNSDAGVTGQIVIDERNFDILRFPTSLRDFADGTAFRGGGQGFRLEAMPGSEVQRYMASFTEPYLFDTQVSFNLSGFLFDRRYFDWDERRLGGRVGLGYRLTPDLAFGSSLRMENVNISDPRVLVPQLAEVLGDNALYTGRFSLTHDTRDIPFSPTEGHLLEVSYEQGFGDFDFPKMDIDYRQYFLVRERPDGSGRHTLGFLFRTGFAGSSTPIFERYFAGGYSTLRGFDFRGASPSVNTVRVGGDFMFLGSAEYVFPLTADDMLKAAMFVDYGTVEEEIKISSSNYRVAPGFGLRINVPALGPAPLAFDFAFPVAKADTDDTRVFNFFFGVGR